ncbi:hypothetical protein M1523_01470 [Patescibacteria group bacterium]|nr:hypothetical protein [Patescibacteria group bacterium]MCL5091550.1 hypothetical protein [Patescibacteria group bacterium]
MEKVYHELKILSRRKIIMFDALANYISEVVRGKKIRIGGQDAQWKKVVDIKVGMKIAVTKQNSNIISDFGFSASDSDVEWDEIVSIKRLSPERVYDIEVEDTHNFVAGHFIDLPSGNETILTDEPQRGPPTNNFKIKNLKLKIGQKWFGGIIAHNTYAAIFNGGNVGIGTTSPAAKLEVYQGGVKLGSTAGANNILDTASSGGAPSGSLYWGSRIVCDNSGNCAGVGSLPLSSITAATGTNTIDSGAYAQTWNWNSLASGNAFTLGSSSTAGAASGTSTVLNISRSGANANTAHTAYGLYSTVTNTNVTSGTNVAGYFSASGATTANYALYSAAGVNYFAGNVGVGTTSPSSYTLQVVGTGGFSTSVNSPLFQGQGAAVTLGNASYTTSVTGSTVYVSPLTTNGVVYTSGSNGALNSEQYLATSRGGLGANVTAAGAGELLYSSGTTAYGHLAAGTSGQILKAAGAASPTWNTPGALTKTDDTNVTLTLGGSPTTALVNAASITVGWSGQLAIARGGTNSTATPTAGGVAYGTGTAYAFTGAGTSGQFLISNGASAPSWTSTVPATSMKWNALTNPDGNLSLSMGAYTSTFTYNAATSTNNLFNLTDTASNTGTGYLLNVTTASSSTLHPLHVSAAGTEALMVDTNGYVGIGTTSASYPLDVNGTIKTNTGLRIVETSAAERSIVNYNTINGGWYMGNTTDGRFFLDGMTSGGAYERTLLTQVSHSLSDMYFTGNLGIGTTTPGAKLEVSGTAIISGTGTALTLSGAATTAINISNTGVTTDINLQNGATIDNDVSGSIRLGSTTLTLNGTTTLTASSLATFTSAATLGMTSTTTLNLGTNATLTNNSGTLTVNANSTSNLLLNSNGGNVGIGTTGPGAKLEVFGNSPSIKITEDSSSSYYLQTQVNYNAADSVNFIGPYGATFLQFDATTNTPTTLGTTSGYTILQGNVGVGTTSPAAKLDVNGDITAEGNFISSTFVQGMPTNLIVNGGFETDLGGWSANLATITQQAGGYYGGYSMKAVYSGSGDNYISYTLPTVAQTLASRSYTFSFWAKADLAGSFSSAPFLQELGGGTYACNLSDTALTTSWKKFKATCTWGAGITATTWRVILRTTGNVSNNVYFDGVNVQNGTTGTDYTNIAANDTGNTYLYDGNVGIGTTSPSNKLDVRGATGTRAAYFDGRVRGENASSSDEFVTLAQLQGGSGSLWLDGGTYLYPNSTYATDVMVPSGNVGIGTNAPETSLTIKNTGYRQLAIRGGATGHQTLNLGSVESTVGSYIYNNAYYATSNTYTPSQTSASGMQLRNDGSIDLLTDTGLSIGVNYTPTSRIKILNNGNVGIGTTGPAHKLEVTGGIYASTYLDVGGNNWLRLGGSNALSNNSNFLYIGDGSSLASGIYARATYKAASGYNVIPYTTLGSDLGDSSHYWGNSYIQNGYFSGNVGIGTTTTAAKLDIPSGGIIAGTTGANGSQFYAIGLTRTAGAMLYDQANSALTLGGDSTGSDMTILANGNVGIGTTSPGAKLELTSGDLYINANGTANVGLPYLKNSTSFGSSRNNYLISMGGTLAGRLLNRNAEMLDGTIGYALYDNSGGGHTTISSVADSQAPNTSGSVLRLSYDGLGTPSSNPTPGFGGFNIAVARCSGTNNGINGFCYREGNRYFIRIWAKIPSGRSIYFASNSYGTGGNFQWESSQAGADDWREYDGIQTIGIGGTFSSTGFWYVSGGTNAAFNWDVASVQMVGLDETPSVETASNLNVGYYQGKNLNYGELLTTQGAYLAASGGNVGIGTTAPGQKLEVAGNVIGSGTVGTSASRWSSGYFDSLTVTGSIYAAGTNIAGTTANDFTINTDNATADAEAMSLTFERGTTTPNSTLAWDNTNDTFDFNFPISVENAGISYIQGNVGIGTTAPGTYKLYVAGTGKFTGAVDTDVQFLGQASDTVSAPSFSWTGDTTTGMYRPAASQIALTLGGTQRALFTATALTLTGQTTLTASSLSTLTTGATLGMTSTTTLNLGTNATLTNNSGTLTVNANSTSNLLLNTNGGNVGIGTTSAGTRLDVVGGAIRTNNQLISTVATGTSPLAVSSTTVVTNLNADMVDGLHSTSLVQTGGSLLTLAGDSGSVAVNQGNTLTVAGGSGLTSTAAAGPTVTLNVGAGTNIQVNANDVATVMNPSFTTSVTTPYYYVTAGNGYGVGYWASAPTTYGTFMSNSASYMYGDVTDYYIANVMSSGTGRGFTWSYGTTPSMGLNASTGNLAIKGLFTANGSGNNYFAGNVGIGTTAPDTQLEVTGSIDTYANSNRYYYNVYQYSDSGNPDTGTLAIAMPRGWTSTMMRAHIVGYDYSGLGTWEVIVGGYNYSGTPAWINYTAEVRGTAPFNQVRLAYNGSKMVILLGTTTTTWRYPKFAVTEFMAGFGSYSGWGSGWSSSFLTSEASITNSVTPTLYTYMDSGGNVGIGTTGPSYKLDVAGDVRATGDLYANGTDVFGANSMSLNLGTSANLIGFKDSTGYNRITIDTAQTSYPRIYGYTNAGAATLVQFTSGIFNNGGTLYSQNQIYARGGIANDTASTALSLNDAEGVIFAGPISGISTITTSSTINSQTISSAASFTGTLAVASDLTVTGGDIKQGGSDDLRLWAGTGGDVWFYKSDGTAAGRVDTSVASGSGTDVQDANYLTGDDANYTVFYGNSTSSAWNSQSFTTGGTGGSLSKINFKLWRNETSYSYSVWTEIQTCTGDTPTGVVLGTSDVVASSSISSTSPGAAVTFTFSNRPYLNSSTKYCAVLKTTTPSDGTHYINMRVDSTSSSYSGGQLCRTTNSGQTWDCGSYTAVDAYFDEYYNNRYGTLYIGAVNTSSADLAEKYPSVQDLLAGEVVAFDPQNENHVIRSTQAYEKNLMGVVSTDPGLLLGAPDGSGDKQYPVALSGRVPVKFSAENGNVVVGDPLTSSATKPGYAMRATQPGLIIAKALESSQKCAQTSDCKINAFIALKYDEPQMMLADSGDVVILENTNSGSPDQGNSSYSIATAAGETITRVGAFARLTAANLETGAVKAKTVTTDSLNVGGQTLREFVTNVVNETIARSNTIINGTIDKLIVREKTISPIVETTDLVASGSADIAQLQTNEIKPKNNALTIDLSNVGDGSPVPTPENRGEFARLMIKGMEGKTVASIDAAGNATFSGTLAVKEASVSGNLAANSVNTNSLNSQLASISGKLVAKQIESDTINALNNQISSSSANINKVITDNQQLTTDINDIQKLLSELKNQPLPDPNDYQTIPNLTVNPDPTATGSSPTLPATGSFDSLTVTNGANFYNATVSNSLVAGNVMIQNDTILALASELRLSALVDINLFDGAVVIAKNGDITTKGELTALSGIRTNTIKPVTSSNDLAIQLDQSGQNAANPKLKVANSNGDEVASIDASGSARFKSLGLEKFLDATGSAAIVAAPDNFAKNGIYAPAIETKAQTAGVGILPANENTVIIYNTSVKNDSLVYLTPTSDSANELLTVEKKESCPTNLSDLTGTTVQAAETCHPYFQVTSRTNLHDDIKFNWLIIN